MATYLKGVTDIIPKAADVKIDYDFLSKGLSALQSRYDAGYKQWKSMYNSLINSEIVSDDNNAFRADYLKKADNLLSQLSGVDLSNSANLQQAMTLFDPLVNDKEFIREMYLVKGQRSEINKSNAVKYSTDPKINSQYSPIMEQYLGLGMKRLSEMKRGDGSIERAGYNKFTPWEDPIEYASKLAKDQGVEFKTTTPNGPYMVTKINGGETVDTYRNWFNATVGSKFDNQFRIEAEVQVESAIESLIAKNPNLDRTAAMQEMANTFSTEYVKTYNQDMVAIQGQINVLNSKRKELQKLYPRPNANIIEVNNQMQLKKDALVQKLNEMKTSKVDDNQLAQKATQMFMSNPASVFSSQVRNTYADRFGYKQAFGKVELSYDADPVWIHNDNKAFQVAMLNARQKFEDDQAQKKFVRDVALKQMEKEATTLGAGVGQPEDVGPMNPATMYRSIGVDNFKKSVEIYTNGKVLAVAANMTIEKGGNIVSDPDFDLKVVQQAMLAKMNGQTLTQQQASQLSNYMSSLQSGTPVDAQTITFAEIARAITASVRKNKNLNPEFGASIFQMVNDANTARETWSRLYAEEANSLATITDPNLTQYIKTDSRGNRTIDYAKIDAISDEDERDEVYSSLIPNYDYYSQKSAIKSNTVQLNPADPSKFDYSILRAAIDNTERIGVTDPTTGVFVEMDEAEVGTFRSKTLGGKNMSEVFDPKGTTYERKIVNGVEYIKVTMPLIKSTDKDSQSMSERLGYTVNRKIVDLKQNKLEFLVPLNKAENLGGADPIVMDPITGAKVVQENKFKSLIMDLAERSLIPDATSWVSEVTKTGNVDLPWVLRSSIESGSLSAINNRLYLSVNLPDNKSQYLDITDKTGVTASALASDPSKNDPIVRKYIEKISYDYGTSTMTYWHNQINNNRNNAATTPDRPGWEAYPWR